MVHDRKLGRLGTRLRGYQKTWEGRVDSDPPTRASPFILEGVMAMIQSNQRQSEHLIGIFPSVIS